MKNQNQTGRNQGTLPEGARSEVTLDEALAVLRGDEAPAATVEAAAARVWSEIEAREASGAQPLVLQGCADVRGSAVAWRRGELAAGRALLIEDHLKECAACRGALGRPGARPLAVLPWRTGPSPVPLAAPGRLRRYALAASLILAVGITGYAARETVLGVPPGSRAALQSVTGAVHRVSDASSPALVPGQEVGEGEAVRTAHGSQAVLRLRDGSLVEMSERAELSVSARGQDTTIHLERGRIIVQAAKRQSGHLRVASQDCTVEVTGTVFSVNRGLKGSRVSVIEGSVRVAGAGEEKSLAPGDQWVTSASVGALPVKEEIAWSADAVRHLALLSEVKALQQALKAVEVPGIRHESRLLGLVPASTVLFAAVPNYGESLAEAHRLFEERLAQSPALREWWTKADPGRAGGPALASVVEKVRTLSSFLGEEIVLTMVQSPSRGAVPVLLGELKRTGIEDALSGTFADLASHGGQHPRVQIVTDPGALELQAADLFVLIRADVVVVTPDRDVLRLVAARLEGDGRGLSETAFGEKIAEAYGRGAGIVIAADLERITGAASGGRPADARRQAMLQESGVDGLRHLIFERQYLGGDGQTQAVLSFEGERRGIASWLSAPAPMGGLQFVSPQAHAAGAFVFKTPSLVLDDVLALVAAGKTGAAPTDLAVLQEKIGLRLREDLADTLGGELVLAVDGPLLPTPAWKLVVEVYEPERLQESLQVLLEKLSEESARKGGPELRLVSERVGAQTFHAVRGARAEIHYALAEGYLVAGPTRALVMRALHTRESGETLGASQAFRGLFPPDRDAHVSGLVYQNFSAALSSLAGTAGEALTQEQRGLLTQVAGDGRPTLLCAYGERDGIRMVGRGGLFDLDLDSVASAMILGGGSPRGTSGQGKP